MVKKIVIPASIAALVALGGGATYFLTAGSSDPVVGASDYAVVEKKEVSQSINLSGTLGPKRDVVLASKLAGPVEALNVKVGDRIETGQVLAQINTDIERGELNANYAQQAQNYAQSMAAVEQAQLQYQQTWDALHQGLNAEVNGAENALHAADHEYAEAKKLFEDSLHNRNAGIDDALKAQANAVNSARDGVETASLDAVRASFSALGTALNGASKDATDTAQKLQEQQASTLNTQAIEQGIAAVDSVNRARQAWDTLNREQKNYEDALIKVDQSLATQQRAVAKAFAARNDAARGLETARLQANNQLATHSQAVDQAIRAADAGNAVAAVSNRKLELSIGEASIRAPIRGVVTSVTGQVGKPVEGALLTIADDTDVLVRGTVSEADVAKIKVGNEVTFTTPGTGTKQFKGRVSAVSTVAESNAGEPEKKTKKAQFPIEITVSGDRDGLLLGGSGKAKIVTAKSKPGLAVPKEAVFEEGGTSYVLAIDGSDEGPKVLKKVAVTLGKGNDFETTVESKDLKAQDLVIKAPDLYKNYEGTSVSVDKR